LAERDFRPPVLVLTTFDDDEAVLDVRRAGARGYLLKDVTLGELVHAIETLARGGRLVQPAVTAALLQRLADRPTASDEHPAARALTTREAEVLELMAGGFANRGIARALHLAEGTVKNHVSSILLMARRPRPHPRRPAWSRARSVQKRRAMTPAGDGNVLRGYGELGSAYWRARYDTVSIAPRHSACGSSDPSTPTDAKPTMAGRAAQ